MATKISRSAFLHIDEEAAENLAYLNSLNLLSVGVVPYPRIVPSLFLDTHQVYSATKPTDVDVLRSDITISTLADKFPKEAAKVQANSYLVGNYHFRKFVESRRSTPTLLFASASESLIRKADEMGYQYIATAYDVGERFKTKKAFRELLIEKELPHLQHKLLKAAMLGEVTYEAFTSLFYNSSVAQRAEKEVGGNEGTFFINSADNFDTFIAHATQEDQVDWIISPFVSGDSLSMVGCVTSQGTLTGGLQLQFIDVPESLHGLPANGTFYGNDWGYKTWSSETEKLAERVVSEVGNELFKEGFTGIFGIDFMYDTDTSSLYPIECNPRITGAMPCHSLMLADMNVPPMEYYHLLALTKRDTTFDFAAANQSLKMTGQYSHISFSPREIQKMTLPLSAGVYSFLPHENKLEYLRTGYTYSDIHNESEFLIIDAVPEFLHAVPQQVPGFFKFMFKQSIAESTSTVKPWAGELLHMFAQAIIKAK